MRFIYYVVAVDDGIAWEVRSSMEPTRSYPHRDTALVAARSLCRRKWEEESQPCGVRILNANGEWVDESITGDLPADEGSASG
jgi:hypothetical protein